MSYQGLEQVHGLERDRVLDENKMRKCELAPPAIQGI